MKGKVIEISGRNGILEFNLDKRIPFSNNFELSVGDTVEFEIKLRINSQSNEKIKYAVVKKVWTRKPVHEAKAIRLSKAASEFNVGISLIVEFLHEKGFYLNPNPNTKLPPEAYVLLAKEYQSDMHLKRKSEKLILEDLRREKVTGDVLPGIKKPDIGSAGKISLDKTINDSSPSQNGPQNMKKEDGRVENKTVDDEIVNSKSGSKKHSRPSVVGELDLLSVKNKQRTRILNIPEPKNEKRRTKSLKTQELSIKRIIKPSLIILKYTKDKDALLQLQNIAWNVPRGESYLKTVKIGDKIKIVLIGETENYAIASKKILLPKPSETTAWAELKVGDEVKGTIQEILVNNVIINTDLGFMASLPRHFIRENEEVLGVQLKLKLAQKNQELQRLILTREDDEISGWDDEVETYQRQKEDFQPKEPELKSLAAFKNSIFYTYARPDDRQFIEKAFQNNSKLFYSSLSFENTVYFKFDFNSSAWENDFKNMLIPYLSASSNDIVSEPEALKYLSKQPYWIRLNSWDDEGERRYNWSLFNERISLSGGILFENEDCQFLVHELAVERTKKKASDYKDKNQRNGSILFNSDVRILSPYQNIPFEISHSKFFSILEDQTTALHLLNRLRREAGVILRDEGLSLQIFDKFLEFQENIERKGKDELRLFLESFRQIPHSKTELAIEINIDISDFFENNEIENQLVTLRTAEATLKEDEDKVLVWFADALVDIINEKSVLHLLGGTIDLERLKKGFYIERKVSLTQFRIQREVIKDFFDKKINLDHIESLLIRPEKIVPPLPEEITFINPILGETARLFPLNNQVNAIKKAVGNRNIFLIQGPPGTGKTTLIAEIIGQFAKKGEKVLVASQTHIGVDNVLEKVSQNKDITCMRIGNIQRIREELQHYHIDSIKDTYINDFVLLTELHIDIALKYRGLIELSGSYDLEEFKNYIREHSSRYSQELREFLKQRNFEFLDSLRGFKTGSIDLLIDLLNSWRSNIESQKEYIITPLLYRSIDVVFATCIGIRTDKDLNNLGVKFDTVIIDEAGKANLAESLVAIAMANKVILVGDQMQLPPYIESNLLDERDNNSFPKSKYGRDFKQEDINHALRTSFFEFLTNRIERGLFPKDNFELLNYQYRMHPHIGEFISQSFYNGEVKMGEMTYENKLDMPSPFDKEVVFIDTSNSDNPYESSDGFSARNEIEANCISNLVVPKLLENGLSVKDFAIVAPYKSQVSLINRALDSTILGYSGQIVVSTLDSFQGREFDVIVFSFTRSIPKEDMKRKVGFLDDARRLNVALSRAKKKLILIGNACTLTDPNCHYDGLFNYSALFKQLVFLSKNESIGNFVNITDYSGLKPVFDLFKEANPIGKKIPGIHKSSTNFGHFFTLSQSIDALFYDPYGIFSFTHGDEYYLNITDYDTIKKQINVIPFFDNGFIDTAVRLMERRSTFEFRMGIYDKISSRSVRINTRIFSNPDIDIICYITSNDLNDIINNNRFYRAKFIRYNSHTKLITFDFLP